jgi:CRISPR-associated endonuclease/helicase Cas3
MAGTEREPAANSDRVGNSARGESFASFFSTVTGGFEPYDWQRQVALEGLPEILPIPTGLGKTEGSVLAWAWRRLVVGDDEPLHLVFCLPMRSLVTQTVERLRKYFDVIRDQKGMAVGVHQLMGCAIDEEWARWPDKPWVLVGTQDQLLSRALNRGYSMNRFEWPIHFGLLNQDCRWIIDEVQLMGPGLWTTAQLDWMRQKRFGSLKACRTTWMSATVGASFLATVDRKGAGLDTVPLFEPQLDTDPRVQWWRDAKRPVDWTQHATAEAIAGDVEQKHRAGTLSLVICNTVEMARSLFRALGDTQPKILLTSRFRRKDRAQHEERLLSFEATRRGHSGAAIPDHPGLICVSTQVVEAGVDISAHQLWSELAPWPSIFQRLGRLNRNGRDQEARGWFWETPREGPGKQERIGPYDTDDIARAKKLFEALRRLSQSHPFSAAVEQLAATHGAELDAALQPKPTPLPRALDVHGLFSTESDVHGGFTDVSAFVRGTDPDADLTVFWREWSGNRPPRGDDLDGPDLDLGNEGCPIAFFRLKEALKTRRSSGWLWNDEAERWERAAPDELRPGMVVMLRRDVGGYDANEGWTGDKQSALSEVPRAGRGHALRDDARTETGNWTPLEVHLSDARREAEQLCDGVGLSDHDEQLRAQRVAVVEAAGLHDIGKAHPQWQSRLPAISALKGGPWAKCPRVLAVDAKASDDDIRQRVVALRPDAVSLPEELRRRGREEVVRLRWAVGQKLGRDELDGLARLDGIRWAGHVPFRPDMRHEAASALAMWRSYREGRTPYPALAVYLTAAHHGKVRTVLRATTKLADDVFGVRREPEAIRVLSKWWPLDFSIAKDGAEGSWQGGEYVVTGHGWTGLVADLLGPWRSDDLSEAGVVPAHEPRRLGPFVLAYLEALVRVADWRASERPSKSIKPAEVHRDR